jgi:hypothetical protein
MTTPIPFDVFASERTTDEQIEWSGRPNAGVIFHSEDWLAIPFSLLWGGFTLFAFFGANGIGNFSTHKPNPSFEPIGFIWGGALVLIGQYMIWGRFVYAYWLKKRTYYALTNRRAVIVVYGLKGRASSSAYFNTVGSVEKRVRNDGIGSISFGGPIQGDWSWGRQRTPRPPTFDDIDGVDSVYQIVMRLQGAAGKPASVPSVRW